MLLSLTILLLAGRTTSVVDSRDQVPPAGVSLQLPATYVMTSPVSRVLDTLTLLSNPQSAALLIAVAAIVVAWLFVTRARSKRRTWVRVLIGFGVVLVAIIVLEAMVILLPRPMARLVVEDPNAVVVDFHSHTLHSKDANQRFTAEDRRAWHRDGGFNIGYISDHVRFGGALEAAERNPARAGDGVSELSAAEGRYHRIMSTILLGLTAADANGLDSKGHLLPGIPASGRRPVAIVALPNRNLDSLTAETLDSVEHFSGIELVDAAPRGLGQLDREEAKVRELAARLRLVLVSASNNHGYGRAVASWNLMTIPGWRDLSPDSVGRLIEQRFHDRDLDAVTIVKRLRPRAHGFAVVSTLPVASWQMLGSLAWAERVVWIAWIWAAWLVVVLIRTRRSTDANSISA
ncbi:MAG: hypothetical protein ABI556_06025 [Gemmatimonadales bacterium]